MCKLANDVDEARGIVSVKFINYCEEWEAASIITKNQAHEDKLTDKYLHLYFYDRDAFEIRRIIQIEWKARARGVAAQHSCVTSLVESLDGSATVTDDSKEEELEAYCINETLHEMIKDAPHPYNKGLKMVCNNSV